LPTAQLTIRPALLSDLTRLTEIHNHYVLNTHIVFELRPYTVEQRVPWFHEHNDGRRYRLLVAEDAQAGILGYACTGRFRPKEAYETTVEASIACSPDATGKGIGKQLYQALFDALAREDIHRVVAGIAQPNAASNALHERFGFQRIGTFSSVGRKFGKYWDVMWMERPLVLPEGAYRGLTRMSADQNGGKI
jgi:phosphinothricin acetyltransferase